MSSARISGAASLLADDGSTVAKSFAFSRTITADGAVIKDPTLAAAKVGQLTTRTDANTGTLTMDSGHGITNGSRIDVYWDGGSRYGMTVGSVSVNSVPIDGGGGDDLPANLTAITAMVAQGEAFVVETSTLQAILCSCAVPATVVIVDGTDTEQLVMRVGPNDDYVWDTDSEASNPLGADVVTAYLTHGDSTQARKVSAVALVN